MENGLFKRVMALVAHPDDEIMCAGTLIKFVDAGAEVLIVPAAFSDLNILGWQEGQGETRRAEMYKAAKIIGANIQPVLISDEDNFRWNQSGVKPFDSIFMNFRPHLLISHRIDDTNQSHHFVGQIAGTIARKNNVSIWEMDQAIPGGWNPDAPSCNLLVDISMQRSRKMQVIDAYKSQRKRYPGMFDAIVARDSFYGDILDMEGMCYAEAFRVRKMLWV